MTEKRILWCLVPLIIFFFQLLFTISIRDFRASWQFLEKTGPKCTLGPGQTIHVCRPNTIKHCLMTKHANVEVSGQTVKTACLIKHSWNNWYKPLSKHGTRERIKHAWYAAVQTNKTSPIKHENKKIFKTLIECLMAFKFYQIRLNTIA